MRPVEETYLSGQSVSLVARRHGLNANQLFTWRRLIASGAFTAVGGRGGDSLRASRRPVAPVDSSSGTASPTLLWVHVDHLGRPELMTDATKAVKWRAVYEPFGAVSSLTGPAALSMRFPGQWFQLEAGLAYNWNRHDDATTGRYTQPDPLGLNQGPQISALATPRQSGFLLQSAFGLESSTDIVEAVGAAELNLRVTGDGVSLYGYVRQSPVMWTDPTGLNPTAVVPAVCMINPGLCAGAAAAAAGVIGKICEPLFSKKSGKERATDIPSWAK